MILPWVQLKCVSASFVNIFIDVTIYFNNDYILNNTVRRSMKCNSGKYYLKKEKQIILNDIFFLFTPSLKSRFFLFLNYNDMVQIRIVGKKEQVLLL